MSKYDFTSEEDKRREYADTVCNDVAKGRVVDILFDWDEEKPMFMLYGDGGFVEFRWGEVDDSAGEYENRSLGFTKTDEDGSTHHWTTNMPRDYASGAVHGWWGSQHCELGSLAGSIKEQR